MSGPQGKYSQIVTSICGVIIENRDTFSTNLMCFSVSALKSLVTLGCLSVTRFVFNWSKKTKNKKTGETNIHTIHAVLFLHMICNHIIIGWSATRDLYTLKAIITRNLDLDCPSNAMFAFEVAKVA